MNVGLTKSLCGNTEVTYVVYNRTPPNSVRYRQTDQVEEFTPLMSIAHELCSDVAAAVLAAEEGEPPRDAGERAKVVLEVHSTLRRLGSEHRRKSRAAGGDAEGPARGEGAATGRH